MIIHSCLYSNKILEIKQRNSSEKNARVILGFFFIFILKKEKYQIQKDVNTLTFCLTLTKKKIDLGVEIAAHFYD
jgi:hypothetical protein